MPNVLNFIMGTHPTGKGILHISIKVKNFYKKKFATTLADLLFIEIMLRFSHVKQMYSRPINLTRRLILCTEIGVNN